MKIIVIVGGGRNVGKTRLSNAIGLILPNSQVVKLGYHKQKLTKNPNFFLIGTEFEKILVAVGNVNFLIIESGSILDDPNFKSDLTIFLPVFKDNQLKNKAKSEHRMAVADIIRSKKPDKNQEMIIKTKLDIDFSQASQMLSEIHKVF